MSRVYWEKKPIPIPDFAHVDVTDGSVFEFWRDEYNRRRFRRLGKAVRGGLMYPNDNFRFFHRDLWEAHYGKESGKPFEMHVGLYALCLSIGHATGIYPLLYDCFGTMFANAIMDYAFYNIKTNSCVTQHFAQSMRDDFLFSRSRLGQNWYGNFFADPVNADSIAQLKSKWLKKIAAEDNTDAWLCIDGSNNDSSVTGGELAELGHAKSGHAMTVIGYQWAVRASDGMPVSWTVNEGSMVDSKAIDEMARYLAAGGLKVAGIILDRGFCTREVYRLVVSKGFALVAMLKKDIYGFKEMMRLHAAEIHAKIEHRIGVHGIFATTGNVKLFKDSEKETCVALYYDYVNGPSRALRLMENVDDCAEAIKLKVSKGDTSVSIPKDYTDYIGLKVSAGSPVGIEYHYKPWQKAFDSKGYSAIASTVARPAKEIRQIYYLRDITEKQFSIVKTQLGYYVTRVHQDLSIETKFAIAFVAAVIRSKIELACKKLGLDTNDAIRKLERVDLHLLPDGQYHAVHNASEKIQWLLECTH